MTQRSIPVQPGEGPEDAALRAIAMLAGGVVLYTTNGAHAAGSLHYAGRAVDVALPDGPSADSPALSAVLHRMLTFLPLNAVAEFIWAGPNPIFIKGGRHVAPYAADAHHNHGHVAVYPGYTFNGGPMPTDANPRIVAAIPYISDTGRVAGYYLVEDAGHVFAFGAAPWLGGLHWETDRWAADIPQ